MKFFVSGVFCGGDGNRNDIQKSKKSKMKIGYARVSTRTQKVDMQITALQEAGCEVIYEETASGKKERPELGRMLATLRKGDHVYVWALDRLGRSVYDVIKMVQEITSKEVALHVITQNIDTSTQAGKVYVVVFSLLADVETELRRERQTAGIEERRRKGLPVGRKKGLTEAAKKKAKQAKALYISDDPIYSVREICRLLSISSKTLYSYLDFEEVKRRGALDI